MKILSGSIIVPLMILFAYGVESYAIIGDIIIQTQNGIFYCDSMICPPAASTCHVNKRNNPKNFSEIIRSRKCLGANGEILAQETKYERNTYGESVNINIMSGAPSTVRELTPEEQRELERTLSEANRRIEESLRPFNDGSFQRNLQNHIRDTLKDAFNF